MRTATAGSGLWDQLCIAPAQRFGTAVWSTLRILRRAALAAMHHDVLTRAQATAYSAMLALFPALVVAAALVGILPSFLPFRSQLAIFFDRVLPSSVLPLLEDYFSVGRRSQTAGALLGSLVISLLGAGNVMATLMEGFRRAHALPPRSGSFLRRRGRALALVPLSLVPLAASSVLVVFGHLFTRWIAGQVSPMLQGLFALCAQLLRWTVALAGSTGILALVYHLGTDLNPDERELTSQTFRDRLSESWHRLPGGRAFRLPVSQSLARSDGSLPAVSWRQSLPGAVLATALWFVTTLVFGFYVTRFANYSRVYGSLGAGIALLIWLYLIALCVLIGSEFNAQHRFARCKALSRYAASKAPQQPSEVHAPAPFPVANKPRALDGRLAG